MKKLLNICIFFLLGFVFLSQKNVAEAASCLSYIDNIVIDGDITRVLEEVRSMKGITVKDLV